MIIRSIFLEKGVPGFVWPPAIETRAAANRSVMPNALELIISDTESSTVSEKEHR